MHAHGAVGAGFPSPVMPRGPDFGTTPGNAGSPLHVMAGGVIYGNVSVPRSGLVTVTGPGDDGLPQEAVAAADANGKIFYILGLLKGISMSFSVEQN